MFRGGKINWDKVYSKVNLDIIPWHSDNPDQDLIDLIERKNIDLSHSLDVGCGAGTDAIYFASKGQGVTAIDLSPEALKIAESRAEKMGVKVNFIEGNFTDVELKSEIFTFINDRGCFHALDISDRKDFANKIKKVLKKNGYYYLKCWSDKEEKIKVGPRKISKEEIEDTFSNLLNIEQIDDIRFGGKGPRGYACLMKKE